MTLQEFLQNTQQNEKLQSVVLSMAESVKKIHQAIIGCNLGTADNGSNASGDEQMALDVLSNEILEEELKKNSHIACYASEEEEDSVLLNKEGSYSVAFDPLDGSSLIETNLAIGTIFGVYEGSEFTGKTGRDQVCAAYAVYGPRTTFVLSFGDATHAFSLSHEKDFALTDKNIQVQAETKIFSPGNLRAGLEDKKYLELVNNWILEQKTLRYSGGMVPDINLSFCKKQGIFSYPRFSKYPNGKLRLLYECAPFAFLMEAAGGSALDQDGKSILDLPIQELHQRSSIFIGSTNEVKKAVAFLN